MLTHHRFIACRSLALAQALLHALISVNSKLHQTLEKQKMSEKSDASLSHPQLDIYGGAAGGATVYTGFPGSSCWHYFSLIFFL
jgi:hypothetical protein